MLDYFVLESSLCSLWTPSHELYALNSISSLSIMKLNQNRIDNSQEIVSRNAKIISTENLHYLYPNGHRMTHQMRWLKGSFDRGLRSNIAA